MINLSKHSNRYWTYVTNDYGKQELREMVSFDPFKLKNTDDYVFITLVAKHNKEYTDDIRAISTRLFRYYDMHYMSYNYPEYLI